MVYLVFLNYPINSPGNLGIESQSFQNELKGSDDYPKKGRLFIAKLNKSILRCPLMSKANIMAQMAMIFRRVSFSYKL